MLSCCAAARCCTVTNGQKKPRKSSRPWLASGEEEPDDSFVLFECLLLAASPLSLSELKEWARHVLADRERAEELGTAWRPLSIEQGGWATTNGVSVLFSPLAYVFREMLWTDELLGRIGEAMQMWNGLGQFDDLDAGALKRARYALGARINPKKKGSTPRWRTHSVMKVAEVVRKHIAELRGMLRYGPSEEVKPSSPLSLGTIGKPSALDLVERAFVKAATNGSVLLDPSLDILGPIAEEQPEFRKFREFIIEKETRLAPDGKTKHLLYKLALEEARNPKSKTVAETELLTIQYLEVQAAAALRKMHDKKLAIADKLASQDGVNSYLHSQQAHKDVSGLDGTNDRLAESVFGHYTSVRRLCPGVKMEAASAMAQAMRSKNLKPDGYAFTAVSESELHAVVEAARCSLDELITLDKSDHKELNEYHALRRKTNSQLELEALVQRYALALSFFEQWESSGVSYENMETELAEQVGRDAKETTQLQLNWLRLQIEMRVIGLGFVEFATPWSSSRDELIGTVEDLSTLLRNILTEENAMRIDGDLPKVRRLHVTPHRSALTAITFTPAFAVIALTATPLVRRLLSSQ